MYKNIGSVDILKNLLFVIFIFHRELIELFTDFASETFAQDCSRKGGSVS